MRVDIDQLRPVTDCPGEVAAAILRPAEAPEIPRAAGVVGTHLLEPQENRANLLEVLAVGQLLEEQAERLDGAWRRVAESNDLPQMAVRQQPHLLPLGCR